MIVIRNMFMVKKLFVVSFLIFVMSLSSVFAMEAVDEHDNYNGDTEEKENSQPSEFSPEKNPNNIINSQSSEFIKIERVPMANNNNEKFQGKLNGSFIDKKKTYLTQTTDKLNFLQGSKQPVQPVLSQGYQDLYYQDPNNQDPNNMYQVKTGMQGLWNGKKVAQMTIFEYRRVIFLFWSPLICNSLLNYIFELDNKPSGGFLGVFFSGWRSRTFLRFMSFDVHFNTVLFLASSFCDVFVYRNRSFIQRMKKNGVYFLLFDLVFNAFSLCVNFKVDDYFYITVNLSYFLRAFVDRYEGFNGGFFDYIKQSITGGNPPASASMSFGEQIVPQDSLNKGKNNFSTVVQFQEGVDNRQYVNEQNNEEEKLDKSLLDKKMQDTFDGDGGDNK